MSSIFSEKNEIFYAPGYSVHTDQVYSGMMEQTCNVVSKAGKNSLPKGAESLPGFVL
jgi:hypothetical protein